MRRFARAPAPHTDRAALPATVPFVGPEALERRTGVLFRARLGANESGFGPSPAAVRALARTAPDAWMYGDPELHDLRAALAAAHGVTPAHVAVGEGIDGLFGVVARLVVEPGATAGTSLGAYPTFAYQVAKNGGRLVTVPYRGDREDLDALADLAARERPRILFLANPDNPMGSWHPPREVERLVAGLPDDVLLCLDEAYADFVPPGELPVIDPDEPRVVRFRTFSKAHGLAGLRVGYALGAPDVIALTDRVRNHFGVGRLAQAGALAALADTAHVADVVGRVERARARIGAIAAGAGLVALPSATSFVAVDCGRDGDFARRVLAALVARGVFVRMPAVAPLDRTIRISTGPDEALDVLEAELPGALADAARG